MRFHQIQNFLPMLIDWQPSALFRDRQFQVFIIRRQKREISISTIIILLCLIISTSFISIPFPRCPTECTIRCLIGFPKRRHQNDPSKITLKKDTTRLVSVQHTIPSFGIAYKTPKSIDFFIPHTYYRSRPRGLG